MAENLKSAFDFVKSALPVKIGALASNDATKVCYKNNLSFSELIEPFCTLTNEIQIQGNGSQVYRVCNMHIIVSDICERGFNIRDSAAQNLMNGLIAGSASSDNQQMIALPYFDHALSINRSCPWMEIYRDLLFRFSPPQQHEFLCHIVACMLVVSSSSSNPLQEFADLSQLQNRIQHGGNEEVKHLWMTPNTLKYYVLLHDVESGDMPKAREALSSLQAMYGQNVCVLLPINSRSTPVGGGGQDVPVPWYHFRNYSGGKKFDKNLTDVRGDRANHSSDYTSNTSKSKFGCCLTISDHNALQAFVQQFISSALLPYLEKIIKNINEQLSARKTLQKSLFRATRTLFGSSKSTPTFGGSGYHHDANELLLRKAADLCFLSQMYDQAFNLYHTAKKEYTNDQAWLYAAGASEMAALSNFMQRNSQKSYPAHYMESAISSYIDICKNDYLALRCSLVHVECLQHIGLYQDAAFHLVRMTNESDDLRSAILLEQAAHCYIKMKEPHPKKFAFQLILAGHRFSKCEQRIHALRCYDISLQIYSGKDWQLAEDHLNLAVARQCYNTKQIRRAADFFRKLLVNGSCQSDTQQASILREFISVFQQCIDYEESKSYGALGLPQINVKETEVILGCDEGISAKVKHDQNAKIALLESNLFAAESLVQNQVIGATTFLSKSTLNVECPRVGVGETSVLSFQLENYLSTPLYLTNVKLEWDFQPWDEETFGKGDKPFQCDSLSHLAIPACGKCKAQFAITPHKPGKLIVSGIVYHLGQPSSDGKVDSGANILDYQPLRILGKRLNNTKDEKTGCLYGADYRLNLNVYEMLPKVSVELSDFPSSLFCNELVTTKLLVENIGSLPLDVLKVVACDAVQFTILDSNGIEFALPNFALVEGQTAGMLGVAPTKTLLRKSLNPSETASFELKVKAPSNSGTFKAGLLLFFRSTEQSFPCCRTHFVEHELNCVKGIEMQVHMVTPLSQRAIVVAISVKNVAETSARQLRLEEMRCTDGDCTVTLIKQQDPAHLPPSTNVLTYFLLERPAMASNSDEVVNMPGPVMSDEVINDSFKISVQWNCEIGEAFVQGEHNLDVKYSFSNFGMLSHGVTLTGSRSETSGLSLQTMHHLVSWKLAYNPYHSHKFACGHLCYVQLVLVVFNLSDQELYVHTTLPELGSNSTLQAQFGFSWVSTIETKHVVSAHGVVNVPLTASFSRAGIYNLCGVSVTALPTRLAGSEMPIPQKPLCGYFIDISDC